LIDECLPLCKALGEGRRAVSIGGSYGKRTFDRRSDVDFRLFCDRRPEPSVALAEAQARLADACRRWEARGVRIDGCWVRTIAEVDEQLTGWLAGTAVPQDRLWTIWGYYLPTDIANQVVIEDPHGVIAGWHERLRRYPPALKAAILKRRLASVRYWRDDYHYRHKVERGDVVFLAGLSSRLVHDLIQILFAVNECYYPGDGNNLRFVAGFPHAPEDFAPRVAGILYPGAGQEGLEGQYAALMDLAGDVLALEERLGLAPG
jgi:hypothetical protein